MNEVLVCEDVWLSYRRSFQRTQTLKEAVVSLLGRGRRVEEFWAVRGVSFRLAPGETLGIIGRNGSGKSSLLKVIAGILPPDRGLVKLRGQVTALLELGAGFQGELTGRENVFLNAAILGMSRQEAQGKLPAIVDFSGLEPFIDTPVKHYSSGMLMRLGFSVAVHLDPDVLLVDEVFAVGDREFQDKCIERVYQFQEAGKGLVLVSHSLSLVERLCERALWLEEGEVRASGPARKVIDFYVDHLRRAQELELAEHHRAVLEQARGRWGTREAEMVVVRLIDRHGTERHQFRTGGPLGVEVVYRADQRIERPVFGIGFYHLDGTYVAGPNTRASGHLIPQIQGEGRLRFWVDALPLLEGDYLLSVSLYDWPCEHPFDYHDRLYSFRVLPAEGDAPLGLVSLDCRWELPDSDEGG